MTRKRWCILCAALLVFLLAFIVALVVIVDPFEIYHRAWFYNPPYDSETQMYAGAGVAKSYTYDSIIVGSSMTENCTPSVYDAALGGRFVKLSMNAGLSLDHAKMMEIAFRTHDVHRVVYGLDFFSFSHYYNNQKAVTPDYLYDDDLLNDVQYWFNRSVLAKYIPKCLRTLGQTDPSQRDTMYSWGEDFVFGAEAVLDGAVISGEEVAQAPLEEHPALSQQSRLNVEYNLLPFIEAHPETQFIFFFPPYSLMQWYAFYTQGQLVDNLMQKQAAAERLLAYDNVKIYDFQANLDWILDLDHYVDFEHYGAHINEQIVTLIAQDAYRITDAEQLRENAAVLMSYVDRLRALGAWPDAFDAHL